MKRSLLLFLSLFLVLGGLGYSQEKVDWEAIQKFRAEGLEHSQVMEILSYLTDVYGPRLTNSPNYMKAANWAKDKLTEWGLANAHLEPWGEFGKGWSLEKLSVEMTAPSYSPLVAYAKAWTPGTNGTISGAPVLVKVDSEDDIAKYKGQLAGKIVFIQDARKTETNFEAEAKRQSASDLSELAEAPDPGRESPWRARYAEYRKRMEVMRKVQDFIKQEGVGVLVEPSRRDLGILLVSAGSRDGYKADGDPGPASIVMAAEQYNRIVRLLEKEVPVELAINVQTKFYDQDLQGYNILAEIPGADKKLKDEVVMLGGHFDSWHSGTGATDNAAGSAVALEAVRILKATGVQPRRTVRIALWGGEEQGLLGSRGYVAKTFADPRDMQLKPAHQNFAAYFNLDNGTGKIRGVYLQGNLAVRPIFAAWLEPFHDLGAETLTIRDTGGTDHLSFDAVGLPGFQFIQDPIDYETHTHHTDMDVYDRAIPGDLMQAATIMASFVYNAAMRDQKLPRKPLPEPRRGPGITNR